MKLILLSTLVIMLLLNCTLACAVDANYNNSFCEWSNYQVSIGYWNDNFAGPKLAEKLFGFGIDDFVTTSLSVQIALENQQNWWLLDIYYNVLTNKSGNYRLDLLSARISFEKDTSAGLVQAGTGITASGDFSGSDFQNRYHAVFGYNRVELPYAGKNYAGLIAFLRYEPVLWENEPLAIHGYAAHSYSAAAGPSNFRAGLELNITLHPYKKNHILHLQTRAGYIDYYRSEKYLKPMFGKGFTWGILLSGGSIGKFNCAVWATGNQYGQKQPHFGISFTYGWNGSRMCDLSDITFP
ncbi:MAG: hypothetical protein HOC71_10555 [Candidatus Latescibacteria bacterium]|jgi:hypothetical protein|nr:hypothetical protein [Candidatus Latescibacterota bacterium]